MNRTDKPVINPIVVLREEFDDWAILFNPDTSAALGINPVGVAIWKSLDGKTDLAAIVRVINSSFADAPATVPDEITTFIDTLAEQGYIGYELAAHH